VIDLERTTLMVCDYTFMSLCITAAVAECLRKADPIMLSSKIWEVATGFLEFPMVIVSQDDNFFAKQDAFDMIHER
jgi:hypothetical protein